MAYAAWILIAGAAMVAGYWVFIGVHLLRLLPRLPSVKTALEQAQPATWPHVTIIVPAHNEERVIASCVESILANDYPAFDVIFVLDRCTDRTRDILLPFAQRDARVTILENDACPPDWAGKCNAAHVGVQRATGELLLFTDADVRFGRDLVRAAVGLLLNEGRGLLSLMPNLVHEAWYECAVQPVAGMTIMRMYPMDKVNRSERARPFANGQFLLFTRSTYEKVGGHVAAKEALLEDIAFARMVEESGDRVGLVLSGDHLVVHMYSSLRAMREGWKRIFIEACNRKVFRLRMNAVRVLSLGVLSPMLQLAALAAGIAIGGVALTLALLVILVGVLVQALALIAIYRKASAPLASAILFPVGCAIVAAAMWAGAADLAARRPVRWGGREYVLSPR